MKNHLLTLARCSLIILLFIVTQQITAQKTVSGIVTDNDLNEPLLGAKVLIKGKGVGTVTDLNGKFTLKASDEDVLVFTYVGMEKQEIPVQDKKIINVTLKSNSAVLDEVVAIGYGTVKKSDLTGAVAVVSAKDLTKNPSSSPMQALQGKATGVLVFQNGAPGGGATIRVRGVGSISKGSDPIYIVDGVRLGSISGIQPQDIENLQVLKDASAAAIFGADGSNGVVIINTKRGKSGKVQVSFNAYMGTNLAPKQYDVMNAQEYSDFYADQLYKTQGIGKTYTENGQVKDNSGYALSPEFRQKYYGNGWEQGTNWQDLLFRSGYNQNYHISFSGGAENSNYNVSFGYLKEIGNIIKSSSERFSVRINSDFKIGKYIKFGESVNLGYGIGESPIQIQSSVYDLNASPLMRVYNSNYKGGFESCNTPFYEDANGKLLQGASSYTNTLLNDKPNPFAAPSLGDNKSYGSSMRASVYLQIDFTNWLQFKMTPTVDVGNNRGRTWFPSASGNRLSATASLKEPYSESIALNIDNQLTFNKKFNDVHNVLATIVMNQRSNRGNSITGSATGFDFENLSTLSNGNTKNVDSGTGDTRMLSYLGRLMYDYKGKYFFTSSFRSDGISYFAPSNRRANFPSASIAWKVNEDFFKNIKDIDMLKARFGWGQTGNSAGIGNFEYYDQLTGANMFSPVFGADQHIANARYAFYQMGSPSIRWEASEMFNFGFDLSMYNSKLQAGVEYYIKNTDHLLIQKTISTVMGRPAKPWTNLGDIQNRGIELTLQWRDHIGKFNYGISTNFSTVKNKVNRLPVDNITGDYNRTIVGHSIGALYGYVNEGIIQLDESNYAKDNAGNWQKNSAGKYIGYKYATQEGNIPQPGDLKFTDLNGDGNITGLDRTIIGKTIPSFNYSLGFDFSYKNFDFNMFLYGIGDYDIYNKQRANLSSINSQDMMHNKLVSYALNHWTPENASTEYVRVDLANVNQNDRISSFWIEDGSFLRVKDIQLGYTLKSETCKRLNITSVRLYANASNLYCFTAYKGRDPEGFVSNNPLSGGYDNGGYTMPQSFTFGLQVGF